jgi:formylglycine-generating enzyme required for sulfatase activity
MVVIPAGSFTMGSPPSNWLGQYDDEVPQHLVTIPKAFAVGKFEVTQAEYHAVMATNPSRFKGDRNPVEKVSWDDAQDFARKLNVKTGKKYRLLSEAEWEYATRAGTTTAFHTGGQITASQANFYGYFTYNGSSKGQSRKKPSQSDHFHRTPLVFTICMGTFGNGLATVGTIITTARQQTVACGATATVRSVFFAVGPGTALPSPCALPKA